MTNYNPQIIQISSLTEAKKLIEQIGSDPKSIAIMAPKAVFKVIILEQIHLQDAIIIKQDMLSLGGEVAIPQYAFDLKEQPATIMIMGTLKQHLELVIKLRRHYKRIQNIADVLQQVIVTQT